MKGPAMTGAVLLAGLLVAAGAAQEARPLPGADFLDAVGANLSRAQQEQDRYSYKERRTDVHVNPFGRIGTGGSRVYAVTPGPDRSVFYRRLIERNGVAVDQAEVERQERRSRVQARAIVEDTVANLSLTVDRRELLNGRDAIAVVFVARPGAKAKTKEGKLARLFAGTIWIDEGAREVMRIDAVTVGNLTYGFGLLARLNEGATIRVTREPVDAGIWLPTSLHVVGEGRAMLVRKLSIDYSITWFDYMKAADAASP
jgi:hypothetical protein